MAEKKTLSLADVKSLLEKSEKERELNAYQRASLQHATDFVKIGPRKSAQLSKALQEIIISSQGMPITEQNAFKIADTMPLTPDEVRAVFARERYTLEDEDIKAILKLVEDHL